eukprot:Rhum_TRINITY_DN15407_c0_g1::Rhum_TRINITY_DN15407_c0_g1_i22::g.155639::m.155639
MTKAGHRSKQEDTTHFLLAIRHVAHKLPTFVTCLRTHTGVVHNTHGGAAERRTRPPTHRLRLQRRPLEVRPHSLPLGAVAALPEPVERSAQGGEPAAGLVPARRHTRQHVRVQNTLVALVACSLHRGGIVPGPRNDDVVRHSPPLQLPSQRCAKQHRVKLEDRKLHTAVVPHVHQGVRFGVGKLKVDVCVRNRVVVLVRVHRHDGGEVVVGAHLLTDERLVPEPHVAVDRMLKIIERGKRERAGCRQSGAVKRRKRHVHALVLLADHLVHPGVDCSNSRVVVNVLVVEDEADVTELRVSRGPLHEVRCAVQDTVRRSLYCRLAQGCGDDGQVEEINLCKVLYCEAGDRSVPKAQCQKLPHVVEQLVSDHSLRADVDGRRGSFGGNCMKVVCHLTRTPVLPKHHEDLLR